MGRTLALTAVVACPLAAELRSAVCWHPPDCLQCTAFHEHADAGGLISYGIAILQNWRRSAYFVDRILEAG
jgi:hypothetical protein